MYIYVPTNVYKCINFIQSILFIVLFFVLFIVLTSALRIELALRTNKVI